MDPAAEVPQVQGADSILEVLGDDNLHIEILVRLPPKLSLSSPARPPYAVCRLWGRILSDPYFFKRFRKHHRKPPLLGFFRGYHKNFIPAMDSPRDRIPLARFSLPKSIHGAYMGCRHGLSLLINKDKREAVVWDPLTGEEHIMAFPPVFNPFMGRFRAWHGVVLCADAEDGHVHGDCFLSPFKLVLVCCGGSNTHAFCSVYNPASGGWGYVFSTAIEHKISELRPSILVGNALCWLICGGEVLVFDLEMQRLGVIKKPVENHVTDDSCFQLLRMENDRLGLAVLLDLTIQLWEGKSNCDGVFEWVLLQQNTIPLEGMIPGSMDSVRFAGYDEDANVVVLTAETGNYTLQLDSMQIKLIVKRSSICKDTFYPYRNFFTAAAGRAILTFPKSMPLSRDTRHFFFVL